MNAKFALSLLAAAAFAVGFGWSAATEAQLRPLGMLDRLEAGDWELRVRDAAEAPQHLCMRDARKLVQLRHPGQNCRRIIVEDQPEQVTIQYTCRGRGYGRTQIRRESDSLVQIDSQGIARGLPFSFSAEARRVGACQTAQAARRERTSPW
jgi:hypothetical protein